MSDVTASTAEDVTVDDFMTGLVATCALRGRATLSLRGERFFDAMRAAYKELRKRADEAGNLDVRFAIILDDLYGDSPVVREAVSKAVQIGLISLDNPEYQDMRIKFGRQEAERLVEALPGGPGLYDAIADVYLEARQPVAV